MLLRKIYSIFKIILCFIHDAVILICFYVYKIANKTRTLPEKILILTNDNIGDAVVRIEYIKKYMDYYGEDNVYFLASEANKSIVSLISKNVITYDRKLFRGNIFYTIKFFQNINKYKFIKLISLVFSEHFDLKFIGQLLIDVKYINAGYDNGDCNYIFDNLTRQYNEITGSNYSNEKFKPNLNKYLSSSATKKYNIPNVYITLGMGASAKIRVYSANKFAKIINYLIEKDITIVLLGNGHIDEEFFRQLSSYVNCSNSNIINLINKTSLIDTLQIIKNSKLFIGVESGLWNCSYALQIPSIVIYGGGHFGRFKHQSDKIKYIYNKMDCFECNWNCIYSNENNEVAKCISTIEPEAVIYAIKKLILLERRIYESN